MPPGGKMPTSAELMAMKQQQQTPPAASATSVPSTANSTGPTSAKPRPRRGSDFMPTGAGGKMPTSAELMAQKQQGQMAPQDTSANPSPAMKMAGSEPRRGSQMVMDQMQNISVHYAPPNRQPAVAGAGDNTDYGYGEGSPSANKGRSGARRRGSVVRTLMEEKNVDGDRHVTDYFNASETMEDVHKVLPQRRSSNDYNEASKRVMLSNSERSDEFGEKYKFIFAMVRLFVSRSLLISVIFCLNRNKTSTLQEEGYWP